MLAIQDLGGCGVPGLEASEDEDFIPPALGIGGASQCPLGKLEVERGVSQEPRSTVRSSLC